MKDDSRKAESARGSENRTPSRQLSRRSFLRAGASAMPVVLTLQSGEALARTSNIIGSSVGARDASGKVLCLDTTYEDAVGPGKVDVLEDGATVYILPDTDFYPADYGGTSGGSMTPDTACSDGGYLKTQSSGGWHKATLPRGGLVVSNASLDSVSTRTPILKRDWFSLT